MKAYCHKCGALVAEIAEGSMIRKGTVYTCATCHAKNPQPRQKPSAPPDIPDFLKEMMGMGRKG